MELVLPPEIVEVLRTFPAVSKHEQVADEATDAAPPPVSVQLNLIFEKAGFVAQLVVHALRCSAHHGVSFAAEASITSKRVRASVLKTVPRTEAWANIVPSYCPAEDRE